MPSEPSFIVAELGPTNTGKTHRAIERMLEHDSGMIGLPLRLLAREVYDRLTAKVGEARVALMTGEEKRVPAHPAYWVCTVEAMPTDHPVDFLAIDEIQLCAHRERGHVFTDRLLHARGRRETWFLGSETMRPLIRALLPGATFRRSERLSQLRSFGSRSLKSLPPRSAVVAFSIERVYELAESLRQLRGGVAVVLGALSPRTRNAQVAMYQSGEVQYLVATDAIGMGLNLDLDRIAFAGLSKFDGFEQRELSVDELGQIAGRAGRHVKDGAFGTLTTAPELDPRTIAAIEAHRFPPVQRLIWRNVDLDFRTPQTLLDTLALGPDRDLFSRVERAEDFDALRLLAEKPEVQRLTADRASVELLWEVCRIPDFRKGMLGEHALLLKEVFLQLASGGGQLRDEWLHRQIAPLDDFSGDLHTLTDRLAAIRTWTYITQRGRWIPNSVHWQERTRQIEDALGDALHQRLVERFVHRTVHRPKRFRSQTRPEATGPFAQLRDLADAGPTAEEFIERVVELNHEAFELDAVGRIGFEGHPLARLVRGADRRSPQVALVDADAWSRGQRSRLERRMMAYAKDLVREAMGGFPAETLTAQGRPAPLRAVAYRFAEGLGIVRRDPSLEEQLALLDPESHQRLASLQVGEGARFFALAEAISQRALERRGLLTSVYEAAPRPEGTPTQAILAKEAMTGRDAEAYGYDWVGPIPVRIDVLERLIAAATDPRRLQQLLDSLQTDPDVRRTLVRELSPRPKRR